MASPAAPPIFHLLLMRVGIAGISGRVGRLLVLELEQAGIPIAGGIARNQPTTPSIDCPMFDGIGSLAAGCDVVIDFTHADTVSTHAASLADAGVAWVLGTTGLSPSDQAAVSHAAQRIPVVQAANFSPGVTLVTGLARLAAASLPAAAYDAEIVEMHHRQKV
ncbi:MAG: 4-hydroxy-tetrahydrodipicolinate reductase, partial [Janthinobacterium lividum]